jgi:hypothetical protein
MAITSEGELLEYAEIMNVATTQGQGANFVKVLSTWDVNLKVNGTVDPALFKVIVK